ncbi:TIR domain-containing protein [Sorangium sp. So ce119]|uniref:TIR domain-containing protein n=1 Tax=Sorangium sp. So ce119 TaxID=3133279 RepID=UPI003F5E280C
MTPKSDPATPAVSADPAPIDVFISYAPPDERQRARLEVHISLMKRQGLIRTWHQAHVEPGEETAKIAALLGAARLVLLLVSADYLAHEACYERDMRRSLARHAAGDAVVLPVLVHACDWESAPFAGLTPLPFRREPVTSWRNRNEAWASVARGIRAAVELLSLPDAERPRGGRAFKAEYERRLVPSMHDLNRDRRGGFSDALGPAEGEYLRAMRLGGSRSDPADLERTASGPEARSSRLEIDVGLIGRETELLDVLQHLERGPVVLCGPDGVGKTALARRVAEELAPHHGPYVELGLQGSTDAPLAPLDAMRLVLRALDREVGWSGDDRALSTAYRAALTEERPVLLLDDARDRAQVESLVVDTDGVVLITAPRSLGLSGAHERELGPLALGDAAALLRAAVPYVGASLVERVAELCGCSPFALCVARSVLQVGVLGNPRNFLVRLRSAAQESRTPEDAVMTTVFDLLPPSIRDLWCRLGALPASADDDEAWSLVRLARSDARATALGGAGGTEVLRTLGLIADGQSYCLHPLARAFATARLLPHERAIVEGLLGVVAAQRSGDWTRWSDAIARAVAVYEAIPPDALTPQHEAEWEALLREQTQVAGGLGASGVKARALGHLGLFLAGQGRLHEAISAFEQRVALARADGDREEEALGSLELGRVHRELGALPRALAAMQVHLEHAASRADPALPAHEAEIAALRAQVLAPLSRAGTHPRRGELRQIREAHVLRTGAPVHHAAIGRDGRVALVRGSDGPIEVFCPSSGAPLRTLPVAGSCGGGIALSADGVLAADGITWWNTVTGEHAGSERSSAGALAMTPDARLVAVASPGAVRLMNVLPGFVRRELRDTSIDARVRPSFSEDGQLLATGKGHVALVWHVPRWDVRRLDLECELSVLALSPDGSRLLTGHSSGALVIWDVLRAEKRATLAGSGDAVRDVAMTLDGALAVSCRAGGEVQLWDLRSAREVGSLRHPGVPTAVAVSADARTGIVAGDGGFVQILELDWAQEPAAPALWSPDADGLADAFLARHVPLGPDKVTRSGAPVWGEVELAGFLEQLARCGLGWLTAEGVRAELLRRTGAFGGRDTCG